MRSCGNKIQCPLTGEWLEPLSVKGHWSVACVYAGAYRQTLNVWFATVTM